MAFFDVNTDASIELTNKLTKLHRSAFPVAVRGTLNDAAFETKKKIPQKAANKFTTRQKNFFKAFSTVEKANGFNLNTMRATVGINSAKGSQVAEGLEKQEFGGNIKSRKLIPMDTARVSKNFNKKVRTVNQFKRMGKVVKIRRGTKAHRTRKSNLVAQVMVANKMGASYMIRGKGAKATLFRISGVSQNIRTRKVKFKMEALYHYRDSKISTVQKAPFMAPAARDASKKMNDYYQKQAERQFKRLLQ